MSRPPRLNTRGKSGGAGKDEGRKQKEWMEKGQSFGGFIYNLVLEADVKTGRRRGSAKG